MADVIVIIIVLLLVGLAVGTLIREKKKGIRCIGCPLAGTCAKKNQCK